MTAINVLRPSDVSQLYKNKKKCTTFFHLNTRSARRKEDELHALLSCFEFCFDVVMLCETWYRGEDEVFKMAGYTTRHINRCHKKGGGLLLMTKNNLHCEIIHEFTQITDDFEALTLKCHQNIFSVIYRPPSGNVSSFFAYLDTFFGWINQHNFHLVLGGDVNINLLNESTAQGDLLRLLNSNALVNAINTPTRIQNQSATLIDVFITNIEISETVSGVIAADISDHLPLFLMTDQNVVRKPGAQYNISRYKLFDVRRVPEQAFASKLGRSVCSKLP